MTDKPSSFDVAQQALDTFFAKMPAHPEQAGAVDLGQVAALDTIRRTMRAVLGAYLGKVPAEHQAASEMLAGLLQQYGELAMHMGVGYLAEAALGHAKHTCSGSVTLDFDMSNVSESDPSRTLVERCVRLAGEVLSGTLGNNELRTVTALKELSEHPEAQLPTMVLLTRSAAARLEAVQDVAGEAVEAWYDLRPADLNTAPPQAAEEG